MGTKNNPGNFDCYENAEPDEPMFVLLARDWSAPDLIMQWAFLREQRDGVTDQVREAWSCAEKMREWRTENR